MAAIDPDEEPDLGDVANSSQRSRATLKIVRAPPELDIGESDDEDEDPDDEEVNGGPSDKEKARKLKQAAALKEMEDAMDEDDEDDEDDGDEDDFDLKAAISKLVKGKAPATDDDEDDESEETLFDETVVCTLNPESVGIEYRSSCAFY